MRFRSGMIFALALALGLGGCAAAGPAGAGGVVTSPTGKVYEPGAARPTDTPASRAAVLANATGNFEGGLQQALEGIAADEAAGTHPDSLNPIHHYLAGEALAGLKRYAEADSMWQIAQRIYPAYELEIEPARENAWATAFNAGVEAYNAGDNAAIREAWSGAHLIYKLRPDAAQNLGVFLTQDQQYPEAIRVYREALEALELVPATRVIEAEELAAREEARTFMMENLTELLLFTDQYAEAEPLLRQRLAANPDDVDDQAALAAVLVNLDRPDEASAIYERLLGMPNLTPSQLSSLGVSLFNADQYLQAAEAFERLTTAQPNNREAWYNRANALYAAETWAELAPVAERLVEIDPLNENSTLILARAQRELGANDRALNALQRSAEMPVLLDELQLSPGTENTTLTGRVMPNAAPAGTPVAIRVRFFDDTGEIGQQTVTVSAPGPEQSTPLEVTFTGTALGYGYELAQ